jgi:hypothetical protein
MGLISLIPTEEIYSEEQHCLHSDFTLGQLEEIMLPKAIDYFYKNDEATVYQMLWKQKHGAAYIHAKHTWNDEARRRGFQELVLWGPSLCQLMGYTCTHQAAGIRQGLDAEREWKNSY